MTRLLKSSAILAGFLFFFMNHTAIGCDADLEIVVKDSVKQAAFDDTGELGAGSRVKFRLTSHAHCYAAVFWKDVEGQVFNLISIASHNQPSVEMAVDEIQIIPDSWLTLDQKPGLETIYLITSETPLTDLSQIGLLLANHDPQEIQARLNAKDLTVRWKAIEHSVGARIAKLFLPPRSKQISLDQMPVRIEIMPRKPAVSPARHTKLLNELSTSSKQYVRGATSQLIARAEKAVVYIFHESGMGTGVVVDLSKGLVVTSEHVIEGLDEVGIAFLPNPNDNIRDQHSYVANVVKTARKHDLALLKLQSAPKQLFVFPLGRSDGIKSGMPVHAIGHPKGLMWTYTTGNVSKVRYRHSWSYGQGRYQADVIQTQTPINPGNSGGPLFTDDGQLIGINTASFDEFQGLNISVSVSHVKELLGMLVSEPPKDKLLPLSIPSLAKEYYDQDGNGTPDLFCFDSDRNGRLDICIVDENEDGKVDYWQLDLNENRKIDGFIAIEDGVYVWYFDGNEDGEPETIGIDRNSDGRPDYYASYSG